MQRFREDTPSCIVLQLFDAEEREDCVVEGTSRGRVLFDAFEDEGGAQMALDDEPRQKRACCEAGVPPPSQAVENGGGRVPQPSATLPPQAVAQWPPPFQAAAQVQGSATLPPQVQAQWLPPYAPSPLHAAATPYYPPQQWPPHQPYYYPVATAPPTTLSPAPFMMPSASPYAHTTAPQMAFYYAPMGPP